jgi:glutathione S-transferase
MMATPADIVTCVMTSASRGFAGTMVEPAGKKPEKLLKLYDIESSPHCRLVREVLTELDLDAEIYPCPKGGGSFRREARKLGGKEQFPFLVDPNTGKKMYESLDIIEYLYRTYACRELPAKWKTPLRQVAGSAVAGVPRALHGARARRSVAAPVRGTAQHSGQMIELYSYEHSPYARLVRETLCELEVPYVLRSCGRTVLAEWIPPFIREPVGLIADSELRNRLDLQALEGKVGIPYLRDHTTETALFESGDIIDYLEQQYAA